MGTRHVHISALQLVCRKNTPAGVFCFVHFSTILAVPKNFLKVFSKKFAKIPFSDCVVIEGQNPKHRARSPPPFSESHSPAPGKEVKQ
jgi:hypothetical protein